MKLLELIKTGSYEMHREPEVYNRLGDRLKGATVLDLGNGVALKTYTGTSWFIKVDGESASLDDVGLTDYAISEAFEQARKAKLAKLR